MIRAAAEHRANVFEIAQGAQADFANRVSGTSRVCVHSPSSTPLIHPRALGISTPPKDETGVRRVLFAISAELLDDSVHLGVIENTDLPKRERGAVLRGEIFDLAGERKSGRKVLAHCDDAVIGEQTRLRPFKAATAASGKLLRAEGVVRRATDVGAARDRDHVMECGNPTAGAGELVAFGEWV